MSKSKSSKLLWPILAIIALLGLSGYLWLNNNNLKQEISTNKKELYEIEKVQAELETDYQNALESIESLRDDNKELNELIDSQKSDLSAQKAKINNLIWTQRELGKAKEEIAALNSISAGYVTEINTLKDKIGRLENANTKLVEEKQVLTADLQQEKIVTKDLTEAKAILTSQKEVLETEKDDLTNIVDIGSAIKINWMQVTGFQMKDDGKLKKKKKAKDVNVLRMCYKTETNMVAQAGEETFYVRYIDPQGETIAIEDHGSGILTNKLTNQEVRYSASNKIEYNNADAESCLDWVINYQLPKGVYEVEMYNKGYMCGKGSFELK